MRLDDVAARTLGELSRLKAAGQPLPPVSDEWVKRNAAAMKTIAAGLAKAAADKQTYDRANGLYRAAPPKERARLERLTPEAVVLLKGRRGPSRRPGRPQRRGAPVALRERAGSRGPPSPSPADPSPLTTVARRQVERAFVDVMRRRAGGHWMVVR